MGGRLRSRQSRSSFSGWKLFSSSRASGRSILSTATGGRCRFSPVGCFINAGFAGRHRRRRDYRGLTISIALFAAAILLPVRLIAVANPDWRLISWTMSLVAVVISLCALHLAGGAPWSRHFAFPILFFLVATPWPMQLEQLVVQFLMRADTAITIRILNLIGTLAVQHGNVIELSTGRVGIDDACTGVRSLQATLMVALFLGEFYRMRFWRRALLVVAGGAIAFVCNIGRTFLLCEVAANSGVAAIHRWHDPAGFTILVICLFALWGLSMWLKPAPAADSTTYARTAGRCGISGTLVVECARPMDRPHGDRRGRVVCAGRGAKNGQRTLERRLADQRARLSPRTDFRDRRDAVALQRRRRCHLALGRRSPLDDVFLSLAARPDSRAFCQESSAGYLPAGEWPNDGGGERRAPRHAQRRQTADSLLSLR